MKDRTENAIAVGDCKLAVALSDSIRSFASASGDFESIFYSYMLSGNALECSKMWKSAAIFFHTAFDAASSQNSPAYLEKALQALSNNAELAGNYESALVFTKQQIGLSDSLAEIQKNHEIFLLQQEVKKEQDIRKAGEMKIDQMYMESEKYSDYLLYAAIAGGLFLVGVLVFTIFYININKRLQSDLKNALLNEKLGGSALEQEYVKKKWQTEKLRYLISYEQQESSAALDQMLGNYLEVVNSARHHLDELGKVSGNNHGAGEYLKLRNLLTKAGMELKNHSVLMVGKPSLEIRLKGITEALSSAKLKIEFKSSGKSFALENDLENAVFRIADELLSNSVQYSGATAAGVSLIYSENDLSMSVWDNGSGFDLDSLSGKGKGLPLVAGLVAYLNAELDIKANEGTLYVINIPRR
ncbi:MAG: hypothetical protein IT223_10490 [Crocinitomicaceae bacterium]|nr:hypothetical protein [Crocinitomicaceae bacterium]